MKARATALLLILLPMAGAEKSRVSCTTTAGAFTVTLDTAYSPKGVSRFLELVDHSFFDGMLLYRVIKGFLVQFGVAADPKVQSTYQNARFADEPNLVPFRAGTVSFAGAGKDSRTCHLFVALEPSGVHLGKAAHETTIGHLDRAGIETFERVVKNHQAAGYGDTGSLQGGLVQRGNAAAAKYPKLDSIKKCTRVAVADEL